MQVVLWHVSFEVKKESTEAQEMRKSFWEKNEREKETRPMIAERKGETAAQRLNGSCRLSEGMKIEQPTQDAVDAFPGL